MEERVLTNTHHHSSLCSQNTWFPSSLTTSRQKQTLERVGSKQAGLGVAAIPQAELQSWGTSFLLTWVIFQVTFSHSVTFLPLPSLTEDFPGFCGIILISYQWPMFPCNIPILPSPLPHFHWSFSRCIADPVIVKESNAEDSPGIWIDLDFLLLVCRTTGWRWTPTSPTCNRKILTPVSVRPVRMAVEACRSLAESHGSPFRQNSLHLAFLLPFILYKETIDYMHSDPAHCSINK